VSAVRNFVHKKLTKAFSNKLHVKLHTGKYRDTASC